ncbi:putative transposase, partial [Escherichia coli P0298942.6]
MPFYFRKECPLNSGYLSNRWLLNDVCRLAVENLLYAARKRGLEPGIFCA